jgi:serine O-acetyltransferase
MLHFNSSNTNWVKIKGVTFTMFPTFINSFKEDVETVLERDPAASGWWEVLLCYPGLHAVWCHRLVFWLWNKRFRLLARLLSQWARSFTGIEIHPGAYLGRRLFIDHGMGVVIGETAIVGDDVTLYQGVTLGGTGKEKGKKRHPTLKQGVTVGSGAKLLGSITIGKEATIGASSVVLKDIPEKATVVGVPGVVIAINGERVVLPSKPLPPQVPSQENDCENSIEALQEMLTSLQQQVQSLQHQVEHR